MKKMVLMFLILFVGILIFSTWSCAEDKACSCGQTPPVDNSIPDISQPTIPSNPSSLDNNSPSGIKKSSSSSKTTLIDYSVLTITQFTIKDNRYRVNGITDLPSGTRLVVSLKTNPETTFNLQKIIEVQNGSFTASFRVTPDFPNKEEKILIEIVCDPKMQNIAISQRIDRYGENLTGEKMILVGKVQILKDTDIFDLS
ncbi:MAG TPA: hypothetical protein DF698_04800 [Candidatus Atribacteria bacterium]|nr:hypothetical protein [Candidatus Atribacteria bacterium]